MVNWVEAQNPVRNFLVRMAGLKQQTVELFPGTRMTFWVPKKRNEKKPAVVLVHGFAAEGVVTWQFQIGCLASKYDVYVPDLFFFGGSTTDSPDRSPGFQAECLGRALDSLGVARCTVVGFSYGGMVAFKLAEERPELVEALVISGSVFAMTDSISDETLGRLGFSSSRELLMPESVRGLKALLSVTMHKQMWFPDRMYHDFLQAMFSNRKERAELLDGLIVSNIQDEAKAPCFPQRILLLWGQQDQIFDVELAKNMKQLLGEKVEFQAIKRAGHLVHLERPCAYNFHLKKYLKHLHLEGTKKSN